MCLSLQHELLLVKISIKPNDGSGAVLGHTVMFLESAGEGSGYNLLDPVFRVNVFGYKLSQSCYLRSACEKVQKLFTGLEDLGLEATQWNPLKALI